MILEKYCTHYEHPNHTNYRTANRQKNNTTKKTQQSHRTSSENIYRHRTQPYTNTNKKICSVPLNLKPRVSIDIKLDNGQVGISSRKVEKPTLTNNKNASSPIPEISFVVFWDSKMSSINF